MEAMQKLRMHLRNSGYLQLLTCDEPQRVSVLDLQIERTGSSWRVAETERGQLAATFIETPEESEAVKIFLQLASTRIYHLKTYTDAEKVAKIEAALRHADIPFQRNDVPCEGKLRVFVTGNVLLKAQKVVATLGA